MRSNNSVEYTKVSTADFDHLDDLDLENVDLSQPSHAISNSRPFPISKPPVKHRDVGFGIAFLLHFICIFLLSFVENNSLKHAAISYQRAGSWASIIMISTLLGSFFGALSLMVLMSFPQHKESILSFCLMFSLVLKICVGNILLIMRSNYSIVGCLVLFSAVWDGIRYKQAKVSIPFTVMMMNAVETILCHYGSRLKIVYAGILAAQTCVLLWWGAFSIGLIATINTQYLIFLIPTMYFSLFWISSFFHQLLSFVLGGCVVWYYVQEDLPANAMLSEYDFGSLPSQSTLSNSFSLGSLSGDSSQHARSLNPDLPIDEDIISPPSTIHKTIAASSTSAPSLTPLDTMKQKVFLYTQCGLTSSFGSLCKASLCLYPASLLLEIQHVLLPYGYATCLCRSISYFIDYLLQQGGIIHWAQQYHRLSICLLAVYGQTFAKTSSDQLQTFPESLHTWIEDMTNTIMTTIATSVASGITILFTLLAEQSYENSSSIWALLFVSCYCVTYCGTSLALYYYSACVDSLIVAALYNPSRFSNDFPFILLRFFRTAEVELR